LKFGDIIAQAKASGDLNESSVLPVDTYSLEAISTNSKTGRNGTISLGVLWKVLDRGPLEGATTWENVYFKPGSTKNIAISTRQVRNILGTDLSELGLDDLDLEDAVAVMATAIKGSVVESDVEIESSEGYADKNRFRHTAELRSVVAVSPTVFDDNEPF